MASPRAAAPARINTNDAWGASFESPARAAGADAAAQPRPATTVVATAQRRRPAGSRTVRQAIACSTPRARPSIKPPRTTTASPSSLADGLPALSPSAASAAAEAAVMPRASAAAQAPTHVHVGGQPDLFMTLLGATRLGSASATRAFPTLTVPRGGWWPTGANVPYRWALCPSARMTRVLSPRTVGPLPLSAACSDYKPDREPMRC
jgi:hypothetical protein